MNIHTVIEHLGFMPDEDVSLYFMAADAVMMPYRRSHYEWGTSGILNLAISARKPVICSDMGTIGKIVKEKSFGITVAPESVCSLAEGISHFLNNQEKIKKKMENSANNYLMESDWSKVVKEIEECYNKSIL
jgi:glycosyltransferase involved in cell wall biosynthesis